MAVRWPRGIKSRGELRTQFTHAIDRLLDLLLSRGIDPEWLLTRLMPYCRPTV